MRRAPTVRTGAVLTLPGRTAGDRDAQDGQERMGTQNDRGDDWIFASPDPGTLPTEQLPDLDAFEGVGSPLSARQRSQPARPAAEDIATQETTDLSGLGDELEQLRGESADEPPTTTAPLRVPTYARSGVTPNAEDDSVGRDLKLPARFHDLGIFDAVRDVLALVCLVSALTLTFTAANVRWLDLLGTISVGIGIAALVAALVLRWAPTTPPLAAVRAIRVIGLIPALAVALLVMLVDAVTSIPVLFSALPTGPPVGVGVGVAMLALGAIVGIEPRAHCGYLPRRRARMHARRLLVGIGVFAALQVAFALVMAIGRVFTTGWPFSLLSLADTLVSAVLVGIVLGSALLRDRTWFVFSTAVVSGLVLAAIGDNTLRLPFAAPHSAATGFVYLPTLFAAYGVMISRSFVRTMPVSFRRADWIVYAVRAFEFSIVMHIAAMIWNLLAAAAAFGGVGPAGPVMLLLDAAMCACFAAVSMFARGALLHRPAAEARSSAVVAGVVLVVVGFLDVMVNSVATAAGAGLVTGAVALATGIAAALMLTVPAPVRDEFGAPDLARMFAEFRSSDARHDPMGGITVAADEDRRRRRSFPGAASIRT